MQFIVQFNSIGSSFNITLMRVCGLRLVRLSHKVSHRFSAFAWQVIISFTLIVCTCIKMVNWNDYLNRGWFEPVFTPRTSLYSVLYYAAHTICTTSVVCTTRDEHSKKSIFSRKKCAEKNSAWMVRVKSAKKIEIWSIERYRGQNNKFSKSIASDWGFMMLFNA